MKKVTLGVSGSIAAYRAADIASGLTKLGLDVQVAMTREATKFIAPLTFHALTHHPVATDMFVPVQGLGADHISLSHDADVILISPCTANLIAKLAWGICDDIVSATVLATKAPVILAPAMNTMMYGNVITQENLTQLRKRRFTIVEPDYAALPCGDVGRGHIADTGSILGAVRMILGREGELQGRHIVVTAGGTQEPMDAVRHIGNRSSGRMGYALAEALRDRGARVTLITGPTTLLTPFGVEKIEVREALEMRDRVLEEISSAQAIIMSAAVVDFRPESPSSRKVKRGDFPSTISLVPNPDILNEIKGDVIKVGFAAESEDVVQNAAQKLAKKGLDLIVANDISRPDSGFGSDTNQVTLIHKGGKIEKLPLLSKWEVAVEITDRIVELFKERLSL
jgi:phosphopantothenoylcysteine decarboxylase/phosphopantothenate--cysteine ligase